MCPKPNHVYLYLQPKDWGTLNGYESLAWRSQAMCEDDVWFHDFRGTRERQINNRSLMMYSTQFLRVPYHTARSDTLLLLLQSHVRVQMTHGERCRVISFRRFPGPVPNFAGGGAG